MGSQPKIQEAWVKANKALLQSALHRCKKVILDIDAAGYQTSIIEYCDEHGIDYRAKTSTACEHRLK